MVLKITANQSKILIAINDLLDDRKNEDNNNKKINVNAHSISKKTNLDYKTVKSNLNIIKEKVLEKI